MQKKKNQLEQIADLSTYVLYEWAGSKITSRGQTYQNQSRVSDLVATSDNALVAWVNGSEKYAVRVTMGDGGLPDSVCTCPYKFGCKHAVAVVFECKERFERNHNIPKAKQDDERLKLLEITEGLDDDDDDDPALPVTVKKDINLFLQQKTKKQLVELFIEIAGQYPQIGIEISDRRQLKAGDTSVIISKIRREIDEISSEPGWRNHWEGRGFTPDYSGIRKKMDMLLATGCADEVLALGEKLMAEGIRQVEQSDDEGETADEIRACMPVIVKALSQSSWKNMDKMTWAVDAVMKDNFCLFESLAEYLHRTHSKQDWNDLADRLLKNLQSLKHTGESNNFSATYQRDELTNWIIYALEGAGRCDEIIPLCEIEAKMTHSYVRLVKLLIEDNRLKDAEHWIHIGIRALGQSLPGISSELRGKLLEIRAHQKNWPAVAAMRTDAFIRQPAVQAYTECRLAAEKVNAWPRVRECLMTYLETGALPWDQNNWPLPMSGLKISDDSRRQKFPIIDELINIAIHEKKPEEILRWYDQRPKQSYGWSGMNEDKIAVAIKDHSPDRAVSIWKKIVENLIAQVKPRAYESAVKYLLKIHNILDEHAKNMEWERYLKNLKEKHIRKRRFVEILEGLERKPRSVT
ncbi:MAG: SWIM zinc finger family protein [Pseudomonadota bacterium]|nr:SWIM zinc finger family protein [Pseudomonadota bacterium]MBU1398867.1 SWIM zinc finger family protein [Pseudomonadota bacterium]MBU1569416.1 SWIM zinc finger family protein [Pseudomonadota bacterium]